MKDLKYFTHDELKCKCGCKNFTIDYEFIEKIEKLREELNFPFIVNSFFRCEKYNTKIKGSKNSFHVKGKAMDIKARGFKALRIVEEARKYGLTGIGVYKCFIHLDDGKNDFNKGIVRPNFWVGS